MSRVDVVWSAIRNHGPSTPHEIAARLPDEYGANQIGPIIAHLQQKGWLVPVGRGLGRSYVNARLARWFR